MVMSILAELDGRPTVVIEDRLGDIEAAHDNELRSITASYGYGTSEEIAASDKVAQSPSILLDWSPNWQGRRKPTLRPSATTSR